MIFMSFKSQYATFY